MATPGVNLGENGSVTPTKGFTTTTKPTPNGALKRFMG
jgi:hypothetical protein